MSPYASQTTALDLAQVIVAGALLLAWPVGVGLAYLRTFRLWAAEGDLPARLLAVATILAASLRWFVAPQWIATVFLGYRTAFQTLDLPTVPHYGAGVFAFYRVVLELFPRDHASFMWANSIVGVATLPLIATFALRLLRDRRAALVAAFLVAATPIFVRNDNSDALQVPILWWLCAALVLWDQFLETGSRRSLVFATLLALQVSISRPETVALVVVLFVLQARVAAVPAGFWRRPALLAAVGLATVAWLPHAVHVGIHALQLHERASLPGFDPGAFLRFPSGLLIENVLLRPRLFPIAFVPLAVYALRGSWPIGRRPLWLLVAGAAVVQVTSMIDIGWANMARVLIPEALFCTILASLGIVRFWGEWPALLPRVVLVAIVVATAAPTALTLYAPTNEQAEEDFLREALPRLPSGRFDFLRPDYRDVIRPEEPGFSKTPSYFPDYLITPPAKNGRPIGLSDWMNGTDRSRPAYFLLGMRCYAAYRDDGPPPPGDNLLPACRQLRTGYALEPLLERTVPNRGDVWLPFYGDSPSLTLGLYRVRPR